MTFVTPKEKAAELVHMFMDAPKRKMSDYSVIYSPTAIMYAHFCVDEIIKSREESASFDDTHYQTSKYHTPHPMYLSYWIEVRKELNKL